MRRLFWSRLNETSSELNNTMHFYSFSQSKSCDVGKSKGRDVVCKSLGSIWIFCRSEWPGRHSKSSHRLCSPAFRATSLVCDYLESDLWSNALSLYTQSPYATLTLHTPSPLRIDLEHATSISTRDNPHNTQRNMSDYGDDGGGDFGAGEYVSPLPLPPHPH